MKNELKALKEVHIIREKIYEETKDMNQAERAAYANAQAQVLINKYNLKLDYENKGEVYPKPTGFSVNLRN